MCGNTVALNNAILRHFFAKVVFMEVPITQKRRFWKAKPLSVTERLWSNLTDTQTFHCRLSSSETTSRLFTKLLTAFLRSGFSPAQPYPLHTASITQFLGHYYSMYYVTQRHNATRLARQHSGMWNENGIGHSPDHFSLCGEKWSGNETREWLQSRDFGVVTQIHSVLRAGTGSYSVTVQYPCLCDHNTKLSVTM